MEGLAGYFRVSSHLHKCGVAGSRCGNHQPHHSRPKSDRKLLIRRRFLFPIPIASPTPIHPLKHLFNPSTSTLDTQSFGLLESLSSALSGLGRLNLFLGKLLPSQCPASVFLVPIIHRTALRQSTMASACLNKHLVHLLKSTAY